MAPKYNVAEAAAFTARETQESLGWYYSRRMELLQSGVSCSSQQVLLHRETPLPSTGVSVVAPGTPQGRIRVSPCRAMVEGPAKQVSQHEPEQPPCASVSLRAKGEGSRICTLFFISVCAAHAEFEVS